MSRVSFAQIVITASRVNLNEIRRIPQKQQQCGENSFYSLEKDSARTRRAQEVEERAREEAPPLSRHADVSIFSRAASIVLDNLRAPAVDPFHAWQSFSNCAGVVVGRSHACLPAALRSCLTIKTDLDGPRAQNQHSPRDCLCAAIYHARRRTICTIYIYALGPSNFLIAISQRWFFSSVRCLSWTPGLTKLSTAARQRPDAQRDEWAKQSALLITAFFPGRALFISAFESLIRSVL